MIYSPSKLAVFVLIATIAGPPHACFAATSGTGSGPPDPYGLAVPSSMTARATTASAAASLAQSAAGAFNKWGLSHVIQKYLKHEDNNIAELLKTTGQTGVLYRVDIQKVEGETPFYSVVGDGVQLVGAGTSPLSVNTAAQQQDTIAPAPSTGATIDRSMSYFLWFSKEGNKIKASTIPATQLINDTARRFADEKLLDAENKAAQTRALELAVVQMQNKVKSAEERARITELQRQQAETESKVHEIENQLQAALERSRRAQAASQTLTVIASALTLASQASMLKTSLGADATPEIDSAKSTADLQKIADDLAKSSSETANKFELELRTLDDRSNGIRVESLKFIRTTDYPINSVPELRQP
ncbi:hypothetical protein HYPDE_41288 [Hyphomicrobium denitrificans 1NES1]|uniref:Uncharacterized protein n=2 Tax=Hyphomicrobium denitrificans TaxID=53399 RepID=N0BHL3_9HYPH|nr:hypothetical protein HYPDE_41288 [Hyphomicrobium denitrificans 1NES1]